MGQEVLLVVWRAGRGGRRKDNLTVEPVSQINSPAGVQVFSGVTCLVWGRDVMSPV